MRSVITVLCLVFALYGASDAAEPERSCGELLTQSQRMVYVLAKEHIRTLDALREAGVDIDDEYYEKLWAVRLVAEDYVK